MAIPEIDIDELEALGPDAIHLVDVREADEFIEARVPGARLVPLSELVDRVADIPTDGPVYLICAAGGRSMQAGEFLSGHGRSCTNIAGGTKAWVAAGKPFETGPTG